MTTSWCSDTRTSGTTGPAEQPAEDEDSAEEHPRGPDGHRVGEDPEQHDREQQQRGEHAARGEHAVDDVVGGRGWRARRCGRGSRRPSSRSCPPPGWSTRSSIVLVLLRAADGSPVRRLRSGRGPRRSVWVGSGGGGYPARPRRHPGRRVERLAVYSTWVQSSAATTNTIVRRPVSMPRTTAGRPLVGPEAPEPDRALASAYCVAHASTACGLARARPAARAAFAPRRAVGLGWPAATRRDGRRRASAAGAAGRSRRRRSRRGRRGRRSPRPRPSRRRRSRLRRRSARSARSSDASDRVDRRRARRG